MKSAQPTPSPLDNLPPEVLEGICAHLAADLGHLRKRSLGALASTNRQLRSAAFLFQFHTIQIRFTHKADIAREVEKWRALLDARSCTSHVRRLAIVELEEPPDEWEDVGSPKQWPPENGKHDFFEPGHEAWSLDKDDEFWTRPEPIDFHPWGAVPSPSEKAKDQALWTRLADFIDDLPRLRDVDYQCKSQIPVNLLAALNGKVGGPPRLHMYAFSLRSLYQDKSHLHDIDEGEFYLATSPCLSSIRVLVPAREHSPQGVDDRGRRCFNEEAVAHMVRGLAPNLESVAVGTKDSREAARHRKKIAWPGFFPSRPADNTGSTGTGGALETLALELGAGEGPDPIRVWAGVTDFGALRSLHLRTYTVDVPSLNTLSEMAESAGLRSLRSLSLWTTGFWGPDEEYDFCDIGDPELARLLRALPPLRSLELKGTFADEAFKAVLSSHGPSLQALRLIPERDHMIQRQPFVLSCEKVEALVSACSGIADLELLVPRSKGDEAEARIYRALAELPVLDRLSLLLDCSSIFAGEEGLDEDSENEDSDEAVDENSGEDPGQDSDEGSVGDEEGSDGDLEDKDSDDGSGQVSGEDPDQDSGEEPDLDPDAGSIEDMMGHYRDGIINLNTSDRALATDIFDALCLHRSPRLIRLYPEGMGHFGGEAQEWSMTFITEVLSRAWIRVRDDREGHSGEARVIEVASPGKEAAELEPLRFDFHGILESIWPEAETWPKGGGETRKSFPLWKPGG